MSYLQKRLTELKGRLRSIKRNPHGFYPGKDGKRACRLRRSILEVEAKMRGDHTDGEWRLLVINCGDKCACCGIFRTELIGQTLTRDHIVPISMGGSNAIENIQPLCRNCNSTDKYNHKDWRGAAA